MERYLYYISNAKACEVASSVEVRKTDISAAELESHCAEYCKGINLTYGYILKPDFQQTVWLNAAMNV